MLAVVRVFWQSRSDTALEVLAIRQQVAVLKRQRLRPVLNSFGCGYFGTTVQAGYRRCWSCSMWNSQ